MTSPNYYYYIVWACNDVQPCTSASGSPAASVKVTGPGQPWAPTLSGYTVITSGGTERLSWVNNGGSVSYYTLTRTSANTGATTTRYTGSGTSYSETLTVVDYVTYQVGACNGYGCQWSNQVTVQVQSSGGGCGKGCLAPVNPSGTTPGSSTSSPTAAPPPATSQPVSMLEPQAAEPERSVLAITASPVSGAQAAAPQAAPDTNTKFAQAHLRSQAVLALAARVVPQPAKRAVRDRAFDPATPALVDYATLEIGADEGLGNALTGMPAATVRAVPATVTTTRYSVNYIYDENENLIEVVDAANPSLIYWQATARDRKSVV